MMFTHANALHLYTKLYVCTVCPRIPYVSTSLILQWNALYAMGKIFMKFKNKTPKLVTQ